MLTEQHGPLALVHSTSCHHCQGTKRTSPASKTTSMEGGGKEPPPSRHHSLHLDMPRCFRHRRRRGFGNSPLGGRCACPPRKRRSSPRTEPSSGASAASGVGARASRSLTHAPAAPRCTRTCRSAGRSGRRSTPARGSTRANRTPEDHRRGSRSPRHRSRALTPPMLGKCRRAPRDQRSPLPRPAGTAHRHPCNRSRPRTGPGDRAQRDSRRPWMRRLFPTQRIAPR